MHLVYVIPVARHVPESELLYYSKEDLSIGDLVRAPFGRREISAIVRKVVPAEAEKLHLRSSSYKLKKIKKKLGRSYLSPKFLEAIHIYSLYSFVKEGDLLDVLFPRILREGISEGGGKESGERKRGAPEKIKVLQGPFLERMQALRSIVRETLAKEKRVHLITPSVIEAEEIFKHLSKGISAFSVLLSSNISSREQKKRLEKVRSARKKLLIVSTPSYISHLDENTATLIIEGEMNSSYRPTALPEVNLKEFAELLSQIWNIEIIESSRYPSLESLFFIKNGRAKYFTHFGEKVRETPIEINIAENSASRSYPDAPLSKEIIDRIEASSKSGKNIFVHTLHKGYAPATICRDCGEILKCENCGFPLVLYRRGLASFYRCHHCESEMAAAKSCNKWGSWNLFAIGVGTENLKEALAKNIEKIYTLHKENAPSNSAVKKVLNNSKENAGSVLIGTDLFFRAPHEFLDESYIPSLDSFATLPTYKITERLLSVVENLRLRSREKVFIFARAKTSLSTLAEAIKNNTVRDILEDELRLREKLSLPPSHTLLRILIEGQTQAEIMEKRKNALDALQSWISEEREGVVELRRLKNNFYASIYLKVKREDWQIEMDKFLYDADLREALSGISAYAKIIVNGESILP